jgi:small basic protein
MSASASPLLSTQSRSRWFYSVTSLVLLVLMFVGFQLFYLHGQAYPGRPLTPPIRTLIITHVCLMTLWMLLAVAQPLLIGAGRKRLHMKLGVFGAVLAAAIVFTGLRIGIEAARVTPPELRVFGLAPKEFMAVPVLSIPVFGLFVVLGVANRRRPEVHRPMMLMASLSIMGAPLARITPLNELYAGTWWETVFSGFLMQTILAAIVFAAKCIVFKSFDRWLAAGVAALTAVSVAISLGARTQTWDQFATFLLQL